MLPDDVHDAGRYQPDQPVLPLQDRMQYPEQVYHNNQSMREGLFAKNIPDRENGGKYLYPDDKKNNVRGAQELADSRPLRDRTKRDLIPGAD